MEDLVKDRIAIHHELGSWKICVQYFKSSTETLERLHSSKCQQQTLNIQRHFGALSCFLSECKNNVKQQPASLLSKRLTGHWNSTSDSPVPNYIYVNLLALHSIGLASHLPDRGAPESGGPTRSQLLWHRGIGCHFCRKAQHSPSQLFWDGDKQSSLSQPLCCSTIR